MDAREQLWNREKGLAKGEAEYQLKLQQLEAEVRKTIANLSFQQGALAECRFWCEWFEDQQPKSGVPAVADPPGQPQ